eukprot:m.214711 g.214711  ORF g.214711 m.214711 type:complete len:76 (+) comp39818_c0_seq9:484-711(+)
MAFASFAAVVLHFEANRSWELMVYLRLLVREALRCGGDGWRHYDQQFRQTVVTPTPTAPSAENAFSFHQEVALRG